MLYLNFVHNNVLLWSIKAKSIVRIYTNVCTYTCGILYSYTMKGNAIIIHICYTLCCFIFLNSFLGWLWSKAQHTKCVCGQGGHKIPPVMFMKWAVVDNENSNLWVARATIAHVEKHTQRIGLCVLGNLNSKYETKHTCCLNTHTLVVLTHTHTNVYIYIYICIVRFCFYLHES